MLPTQIIRTRLKFHIRIVCNEQYMRGRKGRNKHDSHLAFVRSVTAIYGRQKRIMQADQSC